MQGEPQTVYADVLFLLNFLLTWAMIRCTGILTGRKTSGWREAAGSLAQFVKSLFQEQRIFNSPTIRQGEVGLQAEVHPDRCTIV